MDPNGWVMWKMGTWLMTHGLEPVYRLGPSTQPLKHGPSNWQRAILGCNSNKHWPGHSQLYGRHRFFRCVLRMCSGFLPTLKAITKPTIPTQNMIRNGKNLKMEKIIKQIQTESSESNVEHRFSRIWTPLNTLISSSKLLYAFIR